jgi:hypothetical protein
VSSDVETYRKRIEDPLIGRRSGQAMRRSALTKYREVLAAHLVMSLADLRLKKRVTERTRRQGRTVSRT